MKISLITACKNNESTIAGTIESVIKQNYPDLEYIVVDGQSTDRTLDIINHYKKHIHIVVSEPDNGIYDALNKGIKLATGEIIGFLHADDMFAYPDFLHDVAKQFKPGRCDAVYADLVYVDKNNPRKIIRRWRSGEYKEGDFLWGWMPPHPTFYAKKEVYDKYGMFDLRLRSAADYELMLRFIHKHKIQLCYIPKIAVLMRTGGKSNRSFLNRILANKEDRLAWKLNHLKPFFFTLWLKPIRKLPQYFQ